MASVEDLVQKKLTDNKVVVFSKTYCPYCTKAKNVLAKYNLNREEYEVVELDTWPDQKLAVSIQDYMKKLTGASSVSTLSWFLLLEVHKDFPILLGFKTLNGL